MATPSLLFALYLVQGLPFGFQGKALKIMLRQSGVSLSRLGLLPLLSLPWACKALWAPVVDAKTSITFGRRRTWLLPLLALLSASLFAAAATCSSSDRGEVSDGRLSSLLALVFAMNVVAATADIATDGLAVETLSASASQLGVSNTCQVVGYKTGMLLGGGVVVFLAPSSSWAALLAAMGVVVAAVAVFGVVPLQEPGRGVYQPVPSVDEPVTKHGVGALGWRDWNREPAAVGVWTLRRVSSAS